MVSYARARAGALHIQNEVGLMARPERIVLLSLGLLFPVVGQVPVLLIVLGVLAVGTQFTAIQRIVYVWQVTQGNRESK
jgi:CDP-diacylglycerol---glycerol-3-phosphate 3-phosphatidyltransferase